MKNKSSKILGFLFALLVLPQVSLASLPAQSDFSVQSSTLIRSYYQNFGGGFSGTVLDFTTKARSSGGVTSIGSRLVQDYGLGTQDDYVFYPTGSCITEKIYTLGSSLTDVLVDVSSLYYKKNGGACTWGGSGIVLDSSKTVMVYNGWAGSSADVSVYGSSSNVVSGSCLDTYNDTACAGTVVDIYVDFNGYSTPTIQINVPTNNATTTDFTRFAVYTVNQEDYSSATVFYTASSTALANCFSVTNCPANDLSAVVSTYGTYPIMATATASFIGKNAQPDGTYYARANLLDAGANNVATSSVITYGISTPVPYGSYIDASGTVYYYSGISASTTASTTTDYNFAGGYAGFVPTSCNWLDIGCNLVNAGGFLFTPSVDSINKLGSLRYEVRDRFPFSYFQSVINGIDALHATSTTQMVSYNLNLHDVGIGTTSPMGNILPNFSFLSASSIQSYYPAGLFDAFKGLVSAVLWLMWIQYMFFRVRDFDFKR